MSVSIKDNKETSIIKIVIEKKDYENKVSSILNDYRKRANILVLEKVLFQWE